VTLLAQGGGGGGGGSAPLDVSSESMYGRVAALALALPAALTLFQPPPLSTPGGTVLALALQPCSAAAAAAAAGGDGSVAALL
jgi:hypothetical protein